MAQTFATNASEALVGAEGSHKLSWQQASSQLVTNPVIFTKVHTAKKNQKCIRMKINCAMQRQQTPTKQSKYHCMSKTSDLHANSYTRKENKKMIFAFVRSPLSPCPNGYYCSWIPEGHTRSIQELGFYSRLYA